MAKIKELHEHRFGSHFVNDFPWFRNQIDPIMKHVDVVMVLEVIIRLTVVVVVLDKKADMEVIQMID